MARWTDLATWRGPTTNEGDGDGRPGETEDRGIECRGNVIHIAEGGFEGTIAWQHNPAAEVSSHFVVSKAGRVAQVVDTADRAWTQADGNGHWLSVENEGFGGDKLTAAQVEANAQLLARAHKEYAVPLQLATTPAGKGLGHHAMGGAAWGNHPNCPGTPIIAQKAAIVARAKEIIEGDDMPSLSDTVKCADGVERSYGGMIEVLFNMAFSGASYPKAGGPATPAPGARAWLVAELKAIAAAEGAPVTVTLSDAQLDELLDKLAARLAQ